MTPIETLSNAEIEQCFVNAFVHRAYRARAIFDLGSSKKRNHFFRMLQLHGEYLDVSSAVLLPVVHPQQQHALIRQALQQRGAGSMAYEMLRQRPEKSSLSTLADGVQACLDSQMASLLICTEKLAFIQTELTSGARTQFILHKP